MGCQPRFLCRAIRYCASLAGRHPYPDADSVSGPSPSTQQPNFEEWYHLQARESTARSVRIPLGRSSAAQPVEPNPFRENWPETWNDPIVKKRVGRAARGSYSAPWLQPIGPPRHRRIVDRRGENSKVPVQVVNSIPYSNRTTYCHSRKDERRQEIAPAENTKDPPFPGSCPRNEHRESEASSLRPWLPLFA